MCVLASSGKRDTDFSTAAQSQWADSIWAALKLTPDLLRQKRLPGSGSGGWRLPVTDRARHETSPQ